MAELEQGSHDETKLRLALSQGQAPQPDTTAEDAASAASFGDQADIQDSFGDPGGGEPVEFNAIGDVLGSNDPNGIPYQVRFLLGGNGKIIRREIYVPARVAMFNGTPVVPSGDDALQPGGWRDIGLSGHTAVYLEITVDNSSGAYCNPKQYRYSAPKCTAKWSSSHTPDTFTEDKVVFSVELATGIPTVIGGSVTSSRYNHVVSGPVVVTDPFLYFSHVTPMDVVSDLRFEDTGGEIKCHVTRARVGVVKLDAEDATPKEDWKTKEGGFSAQSDSEIQRVMQMEELTLDSDSAYSYQSYNFTKTSNIARVMKRRGDSDPKSMTAVAKTSGSIVFSASSHANEHPNGL